MHSPPFADVRMIATGIMIDLKELESPPRLFTTGSSPILPRPPASLSLENHDAGSRRTGLLGPA